MILGTEQNGRPATGVDCFLSSAETNKKTKRRTIRTDTRTPTAVIVGTGRTIKIIPRRVVAKPITETAIPHVGNTAGRIGEVGLVIVAGDVCPVVCE